jgi:hypothetical protein
VNDVASGGSVLPSAWNMLEATKITPEATKLHATIRRYSLPTAITSGSSENTPMIGAGIMKHTTHITSM